MAACELPDLVDQPFWEPFRNSASRRNAVAHRGVTVTDAEAAESIAACRALVNWLIDRLGLPLEDWH